MASPPHDEDQYLSLIRKIFEDGDPKNDRTGTGTLSLFGTIMRFDLRNKTLPLFTTKRMHWKGVAEELLWFLRGETSSKTLAAKGVKIWDANGSSDFLKSRGLGHREEGDLGPIYGFQWRHFGALYRGPHADYEGEGIDQLREVVRLLKEEPSSRRILMTAWNPLALAEMALPPCHVLAQFNVTGGNQLSCLLYQRSGDVGLGVPYNVASYSLLTHLLAHEVGMEAKELVHVIGDAHVYSNHVSPLRTQVEKTPFPFPTLEIRTPPGTPAHLTTFEDLGLVGYRSHPRIKMEMAV